MWKKVVAYLGAGLTALGLGITQAFAALPTEVDTAFTAVQADGLAMVGKGFALTAAVTGLMIVLGLFKKVLKKGAGG